MRASERLTQLGLTLPDVVPPVASYVPAVVCDQLVFTAGQLPMADGQLMATGKVGAQVSVETAVACARQCALNALAAAVSVAGDIDKLKQVVKVVGFVASDPGFSDQPTVINGASDLLAEILGDAGVHARSAVGVAVLPKDAPVEIEMIVKLTGTFGR
mgnify:CR=1 FL=1